MAQHEALPYTYLHCSFTLQVAVTLLLLCCLGASLGSRPSPGSFPEGAYALANSTSGLQEEVENFLAEIAAHREDAGNVAALQGDERLQLKNQLNDAYWEVVGIENRDPTVIAARAKAEADQKAAADAEQKKREELARKFSHHPHTFLVNSLLCRNLS